MERDKGKCTLFYCCFRHYQMLAYEISACEVCMICRKPTETCKNPLPIAESRTGKPAMVTLKIQPDCSTVHDTFLWANIYVRSHLGCGTDSVSSVFCRSHKHFKDAKVMQREREIKFISLFENRGHRGSYSPYKPFNHNLYIGIIIFPHIDNPQSTGYNYPKKKPIKIINKKSEGPINLTNHWRKICQPEKRE